MGLLDDGKLAATVAAALQNVAYSVTLTRTVPGAYDPSTGTVGAGTTTNYTCRGLVEDFYSMTLQKASAYLDGTMVKPGDRQALILATTLATTPKPGDTFTAQGRLHTVISVSADPAGATWTILIR
ncbi:hypothetical protein [Oceanibaculum indicum]|uniref:Phage protein n=1 Tax=Oceanibaculum indicum P24 TaxID=1207063 RepID=K2JJK7_9PROT|nr:hypothetical protein [Oceanibaculum indicum]EKE75523.1 hypothetical protein P24_09891 [Oceanibaculum indicum P24]